jgi:uncharacterized protein (TIGR02266 family)
MATGSDKRLSPRLSVELRAGYRTIGAFITNTIINISGGGVFISTGESLPIGTRVRLVFSVPNIPLPFDIEGEVRWVNRDGRDRTLPQGMGIMFINMDGAVRRRIERFMKNPRKAPPPLPTDALDE